MPLFEILLEALRGLDEVRLDLGDQELFDRATDLARQERGDAADLLRVDLEGASNLEQRSIDAVVSMETLALNLGWTGGCPACPSCDGAEIGATIFFSSLSTRVASSAVNVLPS